MERKGQVLLWVLLSLLIIGIAFLGYLVYLNFPGNPVALKVIKLHNPDSIVQGNGNLSRSVQFYPKMRFTDRVISYDVASDCSPDKMSQVTGAFFILEDKTSLSFVLDSKDPQIEVSCSEVAPPSKDSGHFVAGEGGPYEILNSTNYAIILSSKISLYRDETCSSPHIALHEILHALGFDHNNNPLSILYPTLDCKQTLDQYIADEINSLYLEDELPDLIITSLNGTKSGRYLSFSISISNSGLADSPNSNLTLIAQDGSIVKEFEIGSIDVGATKILTVSNLATQRTSEQFKFVVDKAGSVKELNEENNNAEISIN